MESTVRIRIKGNARNTFEATKDRVKDLGGKYDAQSKTWLLSAMSLKRLGLWDGSHDMAGNLKPGKVATFEIAE